MWLANSKQQTANSKQQTANDSLVFIHHRKEEAKN
jgi:hypothetical protein